MFWACATIGCSGLDYDGPLDQPLSITIDHGIPLAKTSLTGGTDTMIAAIATGVPMTTVETANSLTRSNVTIELVDWASSNTDAFVWRNVATYDAAVMPLGLNGGVSVDMLLGADILRNFAVALTYPNTDNQARFEAEGTVVFNQRVKTDSTDLAERCDVRKLVTTTGVAEQRCYGVFGTPLRGGGIVQVDDDEIRIPATRLTIPVCLAPPEPQNLDAMGENPPRGMAVTAIIATEQGISIISRSAYERLKLISPELTEQQDQSLGLPATAEAVSTVSIPGVAVVSHRANSLGACGEFARRMRLLWARQTPIQAEDKGEKGAAVATALSDIPFAVVADDSALLTGLREELGTNTAVVDVILGGSFLSYFETTLDHRNRRTLFRCADGQTADTCQTIPHCTEGSRPSCAAAEPQ